MYNNNVMYILEFIAKKIKEKKEKSQNQGVLPIEQTDYEEKCEHTFFPIDSTGETLACSKCGFVIKNKPLKVKPKNPFVN